MNPLIPLDGYFALTDWLEIPNLRQRALAYVGWWVRRRLLRLEMPEPTVREREKRVFLIYGGLAAGYIALLFALIGMLVIGWSHAALGAVGAGLALGLISRWLGMESPSGGARSGWLCGHDGAGENDAGQWKRFVIVTPLYC